MKDCTTCKYGFVDDIFGFPMCHHPLRFSEDCVDFNMHEEIEESEKATGIEEKKLPEGLEEAAEEYIKKGKYLPEAFVVRPAFIAGAEWMEKQGKIVQGVMGGGRDGQLRLFVSDVFSTKDYDIDEEVIVQIRKK